MPLTPLHYPIAYLIYRVDRRLVLPGLIVGSMLPDIEIPFLLIIFGFERPSRLVLHSLIGAATLGTLISSVITIYLYPSLISIFFRANPAEVREKCRLSSSLVLSCLLGNFSHILLDYINHSYNPLFWPFTTPNEILLSPICYALGGVEKASLIVQTTLVAALIIIVALLPKKHGDIWRSLLIGT